MDALPLWILTTAYAAHIVEEYFLGWKEWAQKTSGLEMSWSKFLVANGAVVVFGFCCAHVGFACPVFSYLFAGLAAANALFAHIGTSIVKRTFSPGLITSVFLFLPLSAWAYTEAYRQGIFDLAFFAVTFFGGAAIMSFPVVLQIIKRKNEEKGGIS